MSRALPVNLEALETRARGDLGAVARYVIGQRLAECALYYAAAEATTAQKPVHDLRVALRRLRAALDVFRRGIPTDDYDTVRPILSALGRALGTVRELDVHREVLRDLDTDSPLAGALEIDRAFEAARDESAGRLRDELVIFRRQHLARTVGVVAAIPDGGALDAAERRIAKRMRQVWVALPEAASETPHALHELRIALKKLRYALEIVDPAVSGHNGMRDDLADLQERLGKLHDVDALYDAVASTAAPATLDRLLDRRRLLLDKIREPLARLPGLLHRDDAAKRKDASSNAS